MRRPCSVAASYLVPCRDLGWRLVVQWDKGFRSSWSRQMHALMEIRQECWASPNACTRLRGGGSDSDDDGTADSDADAFGVAV